jgi:hypothetical protein
MYSITPNRRRGKHEFGGNVFALITPASNSRRSMGFGLRFGPLKTFECAAEVFGIWLQSERVLQV